MTTDRVSSKTSVLVTAPSQRLGRCHALSISLWRTRAHGLMQCCTIQPERDHSVLNYELYYALDTASLIFFVVVVAGYTALWCN